MYRSIFISERCLFPHLKIKAVHTSFGSDINGRTFIVLVLLCLQPAIYLDSIFIVPHDRHFKQKVGIIRWNSDFFNGFLKTSYFNHYQILVLNYGLIVLIISVKKSFCWEHF